MCASRSSASTGLWRKNPERTANLVVTVFDYFSLGVITISLLIGVGRGVVSEMLALAAWVAAFVAARTWAGEAGRILLDETTEAAWRQAAGFLAIFVAVLVLFALVRWLATLLLKAVGLRALDRTLGAAFGVARGVLVVWVLVLLAGLSALPQQTWWRQALLASPFETAVLAAKPWLPPELAQRLRYR